MKKLVVISGVVFSILFFWLAVKDTNISEIRHTFKSAKLWPLFPMLLCLVGFHWLKALRWSLLLSPTHQVSGLKLVPSMMAGAVGNNLLPAHAGEVVRVYFAGNKFAIPKSTVLATLVVERLLDVIIVVVLFSIAMLLGDYSPVIYATATFLLMAAFVLSLMSIVLTLYTERSVQFIEQRFRLIPDRMRLKVCEQLVNLSAGLSALRTRSLYLEVIFNSLAGWLLMATCYYFAMMAFDIQASPHVALIVLGLTVAGLTLPSSPGFFGTIEYCFVLGLSSAGVDASTALSVAIYYHVPAWLTVTIVGLLLLRANDYSFRTPVRDGTDGS